LTDQNAGNKGTECSMYADQLSEQSKHQHNQQNGRDDGRLDCQIVVAPADNPRHNAPAYSEIE
jgi:hypothetical protein